MTLKKRILSVLFWSVISAAFIGPGTVTTATKAGVYYNFSLLWALVFSTFACLLLQEASARITIYSQMNLGEAIAKQFEGKSSKGFVLFVVIVAIILGCAAYEAGNILGAVAGLVLIFDIPSVYFVTLIAVLAVIALSLRSIQTIAKLLGAVVLMMGIAFISTSIALKPDFSEVLKGSFIPIIPNSSGAGLIVLGLIGTTVIPYDLFLGSGALDKKQTVKEMRFGLSVAIIMGGLISMSIMGVGNAITEGMSASARSNMVYSYTLLKDSLEVISGKYAIYIFGFGMFAAGFSSAITSPLASAITASSLFSNVRNNEKWKTNAIYFKLVAYGVLFVGLSFGYMEVKPIPAIITAQAFNGLILPLISVFLIFVVNDSKLMGSKNINSWTSNILMAIVVWVTMILGFNNIVKSVLAVLNFNPEELSKLMTLITVSVSIVSFFISLWILYKIYKNRLRDQQQEL